MIEKILYTVLATFGFLTSSFLFGSNNPQNSVISTFRLITNSKEEKEDITEGQLKNDETNEEVINEEIIDDNHIEHEITKSNNITTSKAIKTTQVTTKALTTTKTTTTTNPVIREVQTTSTTTVKVKQVVSTETEEEKEVLEEKYGTKKIKSSYYNVIKYDDGTVDKQYNYSNTYYDKSGFNASTNDLIGEARNVASQNNGIYREVVNYVNNYRSAAGVASINLDNELSVAATIRAMEMAYSSRGMSHTRPNGSDCFTIFNELGISYTFGLAENVAAGQTSASMVAQSWYNSPGHRQNMENSTYTKIGIGMYELGGVKYWAQLFVG